MWVRGRVRGAACAHEQAAGGGGASVAGAWSALASGSVFASVGAMGGGKVHWGGAQVWGGTQAAAPLLQPKRTPKRRKAQGGRQACRACGTTCCSPPHEQPQPTTQALQTSCWSVTPICPCAHMQRGSGPGSRAQPSPPCSWREIHAGRSQRRVPLTVHQCGGGRCCPLPPQPPSPPSPTHLFRSSTLASVNSTNFMVVMALAGGEGQQRADQSEQRTARGREGAQRIGHVGGGAGERGTT